MNMLMIDIEKLRDALNFDDRYLCETEDERISFMDALDKLNYTWASGHHPFDYNPKTDYPYVICTNTDKTITWSSRIDYGLRITDFIEFEAHFSNEEFLGIIGG